MAESSEFRLSVAATCILALVLCFLCTSFAQGAQIQTVSPAVDQEFSACSCFSPPTFEWNVSGITLKRVTVELSKDESFSAPVRVKGRAGANSLAIKAATWKKVLLLPGSSGGRLYWRVVGAGADKTTIRSAVSTFSALGVQPVGDPVLSQDGGSAPPVLSWTNECNTKFKVWFGADAALTKKKSLSAKVADPQGGGGQFEIDLSAKFWASVVKLLGTSGSTVYWCVESWDALKRHALTPVGELAVQGNEAPVVTEFAVPTTSSSLTVSITKLSASDDVAVTGYMVTETGTAPSPTAKGWSSQPPSSHNFSAEGTKTLYAWARDGGGKVSAPLTAQVRVTLPAQGLQLESYTYKAYLRVGGPLENIFTMKKPKGWEVNIAGACTTLAFLIRDPTDSLRQIFYFGEIYPVYVSQSQKDWDVQYCGPSICSWVDAPVVSPLTVNNFFSHWPEIASMKNATSFMTEFPRLDDIALVSSVPQSPMLSLSGAATSLVRGVFSDGVTAAPAAAQGQFLGTVLADNFYGKGGGYMVFGATAPVMEFKGSLDKMVESLNSFTMSDLYLNWCVLQMGQTWDAVAAIGQTLREASDIIWEGWQSRTATQDVMAYQESDSIAGVEKLWDPGTGNVYEFDAGFYDRYSLDPGAYNISTLQTMPDSRTDLWEGLILDGPQNVHLH